MALIDTPKELKAHNSALAGGMKLESVQSFIDEAINRHIIPAIGYGQYTELVAVKAAVPNDQQKRVIDLLQKSLVGFMIYYWSDQGAVMFSDAGIHVAKDANKLPASDKKIISLKKQNIFSGYSNLELAISFIEDNINDFPIYKVSAAHESNRSLLINTSREFQDAGVNINYDARLYQTLRTYQQDVESTYLESALGSTLKDALHLAILNGTVTPAQKELLKRVRKAVAFYTMAEAIPFMALSMDASGIFELSETVGGISGNVENRSSASDRRLAVAMNGYLMNAEKHLEVLRKYLNDHKEDFNYISPEAVNINDSYTNTYFF
jgi:hypothetical protein